jgi:hypothetical protein
MHTLSNVRPRQRCNFTSQLWDFHGGYSIVYDIFSNGSEFCYGYRDILGEIYCSRKDICLISGAGFLFIQVDVLHSRSDMLCLFSQFLLLFTTDKVKLGFYLIVWHFNVSFCFSVWHCDRWLTGLYKRFTLLQ